LLVIQANLDHLQVGKVELEVEYQKIKANQKSLELVVAMDARKLKFTRDQTKCLEKKIVDLDVRLHSHANDFKKSTETIKCLQLNVQELSCHAPIT
jgi:hypothetical protein